MLAILAAPASASAIPITIGDNFFDPSKSTQDLEDGTFDWRWGPDGLGTADIHNVVQDDELFRSGEPVSSDPDGYSVTASAGKYPYFCQIHVGMEGVVGVRPVVDTEASTRSARGTRVSWASDATTTGSKYDVRYRVAKKKWKLWKKGTAKTSGVFSKQFPKGKASGKVKLQARSKSGKDRSEWSPKLKLTG